LTVVAIASTAGSRALVSLTDPIRESSHQLIQRMNERGIRVILCSGDDHRTSQHVGGLLGIDPADRLGRFSPEDKHALVEDLQNAGHTVAMIGDGVNDAAALRAAQVGVAVSGASTASRVAADAYTTRPGLEAVEELLVESVGILAVVRRNLGFSLFYNVAGGVAALAGLVTPLFAAVAMPISSFIVVLSSIRQRTFRGQRATT